GHASSTSPKTNNFNVFDFLIAKLQCVKQTCTSYDSCTVLVVMKHGNIALLFENALNLKALWRFNIFKVDTAKGFMNTGYRINKCLSILRLHFDIENINSCKALK